MENDPENHDLSAVTPILTRFVEFLSKYTETGTKTFPHTKSVQCTRNVLIPRDFLIQVKEADSEILTAIGLCPQFGEKVLVQYLKNTVQLPPGTLTVDTLQFRRPSTVPEYRDAINQGEPVNEFDPFNEFTPNNQFSPVDDENHHIGQAGPSHNDWYQVEGDHTIQGPYYSRQAPQSGLEFMTPIGDYHIHNEERASLQHRDKTDNDERSFNQYQYEGAVANSQGSLDHQQASRSALSTTRRNDLVKPAHEQGKIGTRSKRKGTAGLSQASSYHQQASLSVLFTNERNGFVKPFHEQGKTGARSKRELRSQASSRYQLVPRSASKVLPKKERNNRVQQPRVQKKTIASSKDRRRKLKYESDVSRTHFYVLEQEKVWRKGDRLHIPIDAILLPENQKNPVEGGTVIMTYIGCLTNSRRVSLWECRCVGINGGYIPGSLPFFQATSTISHIKM